MHGSLSVNRKLKVISCYIKCLSEETKLFSPSASRSRKNIAVYCVTRYIPVGALNNSFAPLELNLVRLFKRFCIQEIYVCVCNIAS